VAHATAPMRRLVLAVQQLSLARDLATVQRIVRSAARELTGCDGATFVLREDGKCHYADEDAIAPLWKGRRFPLESCISGWAMLHKQPAAIGDIYEDARIPHEAYRPTFVKSLVMVPIRAIDPIGAIGNYWAHRHEATEDEIELLQALADSTSVALENVRVYEELERRVQERTAALQEAHDLIHALSITDEMTDLSNRRGFFMLAEQVRAHAFRQKQPATLLFLDLDGLKAVNDSLGHEAGDALIKGAARVLRSCFRQSDVIARMGGDEFCVLALDTDDGASVLARLDEQLARHNEHMAPAARVSFSVGRVSVPPDLAITLDELLASADRAMYENKRRRRRPSQRRTG
jgi:diguanylate cyclase (GGDEF)-like protein